MQQTNPTLEAIKQMPEYQAFFNGVSTILKEIKSQNSLQTKALLLSKSIDMTAKSNFNITLQMWWDRNFGNDHKIEIHWF